MLMPEAAMDKDRGSPSREANIRRAGKLAVPEREAVSHPVKQ